MLQLKAITKRPKLLEISSKISQMTRTPRPLPVPHGSEIAVWMYGVESHPMTFQNI